QVVASRNNEFYPGRITRILRLSSREFVDPLDDFVNENLRLMRAGKERGRKPATSQLFNGHLDDGHFSALGSAVWARAVAERLTLLISPAPKAAGGAPHPVPRPNRASMPGLRGL
ncbi:MAG TPA: hypothetical protein VGZ22_00240, partial [Isosphaeraceae bacterium]|nr:hypothetical protein [Isosphaeraceae bacterium]